MSIDPINTQNKTVSCARSGSDYASTASDLSPYAPTNAKVTDEADSAPTPAKHATTAARQKARRARVKAGGLLSLRLNVTASEAASLKTLLHALRQAASVQESRETPPAPSQPATFADTPRMNVTQGANLDELRRRVRQRRERESLRAEECNARNLAQTESTQKKQSRETILAQLKGRAR